MHDVYTPAWRERVRDGAQRSAFAMVPIMLEEIGTVATAVDVGGGEGWFADRLRWRDVKATVVDGAWAHPDVVVDFEQPPYPELGPFDLALCLETAEHVRPEHAEAFVAWLCSLAPRVVFSAAIPGQGGEGHVNEQWPAYWASHFAANGYGYVDELRWRLWDDERICWWYRQNLMMFVPSGDIHPGPVSVVHPGAWAHHGRT